MGTAAILYSWLTTAITPIVSLHFHMLKPRYQEAVEKSDKEVHGKRERLELNHGRERLGFPSFPKPEGALIWFHAVSVGEAMEALPMIKKCMEDRSSVSILMTTVTFSAYSVLQKTLPEGVICQFAPVDTPAAVDRFLRYWQPRAAIFIESELWPNLILATSSRGIPMALLNARMSPKSYWRWSLSPVKVLVKEIITRFTLITPVNNKEAVRYQNLGARSHQIYFGGNLKYASGAMDFSVVDGPLYHSLRKQILGRAKIWLAASTHPGEEKVVVSVHKRLKALFSNLLTVIVPRHPERGAEIKRDTLQAFGWRPPRCMNEMGWQVSQRSLKEPVSMSTEVYIADTLGELAMFYHLVDVAFVGGSLVEGLCGHNIAEPASAGCAVITGCHVGHFQDMIAEMQTRSPLAVEQVSGEDELFVSVRMLLENKESLAVRREAALVASNAAAANVVNSVYELLQVHVLNQVLGKSRESCTENIDQKVADLPKIVQHGPWRTPEEIVDPMVGESLEGNAAEILSHDAFPTDSTRVPCLQIDFSDSEGIYSSHKLAVVRCHDNYAIVDVSRIRSCGQRAVFTAMRNLIWNPQVIAYRLLIDRKFHFLG